MGGRAFRGRGRRTPYGGAPKAKRRWWQRLWECALDIRAKGAQRLGMRPRRRGPRRRPKQVAPRAWRPEAEAFTVGVGEELHGLGRVLEQEFVRKPAQESLHEAHI